MDLSIQPTSNPGRERVGLRCPPSLAADFGYGDGEVYGHIFRLSSASTQWLAAKWTSRQPRAK